MNRKPSDYMTHSWHPLHLWIRHCLRIGEVVSTESGCLKDIERFAKDVGGWRVATCTIVALAQEFSLNRPGIGLPRIPVKGVYVAIAS